MLTEQCTSLLAVMCFIAHAWAWSEPAVVISTGTVLGQKLVSATNRLYYSFQGIPYAAPPVGHLRFKAPQPPQPWNETLRAFEIPPACLQPWKELSYFERFSEDCLYINIFTPYMKPPQEVPMAVMVWIHSGNYYEGSSTRYKFGADFLITDDVILVTFNYRLGVFGYLNLNTRSAQGNAAQKDKIAALKWVKREIHNFGGDPNRVTIFGDGSGAKDVHYLYVSPMAEGLFQRAIAESCTICNAMDNQLSNPGLKLAELVGCPTDDAEATVACLRSISAHFLAERQMVVSPTQPGVNKSPFTPTIEEFHGEEVFLPMSVYDLMRRSTSTVPYIMGINSGDGEMTLRKGNSTIVFNDVETNLNSYLPDFITENADQNTLDMIENKLKQYYFGGEPISQKNVADLVNLMTDLMYTNYVTYNAKSIGSHAPVYLYYFDFKGEFESPSATAESFNVTVVTHGNELGYLFYQNAVITEHNRLFSHQKECITASRMVRLWTNMAKYGNPTPVVGDGLLNVTWIPVDVSLTRHFVINDSLHMVNHNMLADRMEFWFSLLTPVQDSLSTSSPQPLTTINSHSLTTPNPPSLSTPAPPSVTATDPQSLSTTIPHSLTTLQPPTVEPLQHSLPTLAPRSLTTTDPQALSPSDRYSLTTPNFHSPSTIAPHSLTTHEPHSMTPPAFHSLTTTNLHSLSTPNPRSPITPNPHSLPTNPPHTLTTHKQYPQPTADPHLTTPDPHTLPTSNPYSLPTPASPSLFTPDTHILPTHNTQSLPTSDPHSLPMSDHDSLSTTAPDSVPMSDHDPLSTTAPHVVPIHDPSSFITLYVIAGAFPLTLAGFLYLVYTHPSYRGYTAI